MRRRTIVLTAVVSFVAVLTGCSGSGSTATSTSTTRTRSPASRTTTTTQAGVSSTTSTTAPCPPLGSTAAVNDGFPDRKSGLTGKAVRTGAHACFERFVVELGSTQTNEQFPGNFVRYVPKPIALSPADQPISIRGDVVLMVSIGAWMNGPEGNGYTGSKDVVPTNVSVIREYRLTEDFEGQSAWALGLDRTRSFRVTTLASPPRLVVDVATG